MAEELILKDCPHDKPLSDWSCSNSTLEFDTHDWCARCIKCGGYVFVTPFDLGIENA